MADKGLAASQDITSPVEDGQEDGSVQVNLDRSSTSREIRIAIRAFGYPKIATGVRAVLLTFARSPEIREAVRRQMGSMAPAEERR